MRVFKNKPFSKWAKEQKLSDRKLEKAIQEIECGLFDASLGSHLFKKRVPLGSRGKSAGARTILAYKKGDKAFFLHGFPKNIKSNITEKEEDALKKLGRFYLQMSGSELNKALKESKLYEVSYDSKNK